MAQQKIPASPNYRYTYYAQLRGIDLTCDETQTPRYRASDLLNIMPDTATLNPRKRYGWRKLYALPNSDTRFLGSRHIVDWGIDLIVTNKAVYWHDSSISSWNEDNVHVLIQNTAEVEASVGFVGFDTDRDYRLNVYNKRYILMYADSDITAEEIEGGYVPITVISRNPDGTDGYAYEAVNAFTPERQIQFLGDSESTDFYFYPTADRANHVVVDIEKVEVRDADTGDWAETTAYTKIATGETVRAYSDTTKTVTAVYDTYIGITLAAACEPIVDGQDNIRVTVVEFSPDEDEYERLYGYANPILTSIIKKNVCARYGYKSMDREFYVADNRRIYYTEPDNYDYLPDNNFLEVEVDAPIMGFHRRGTCLIAITQSSAEFTMFMISGQVGAITHSVLNENGVREDSTEEMTYFIADTAMAGIGAISGKTFGTLVDDTLFLSRQGIYGITSNSTTSETLVANRSELINPRLEKEKHLENAVATIWNGMYILAVNGHVYALDSHSTHKNVGVSYGYECYYWDNIPATDFLSYQGNLFFGDSEGNWCKFNTDIPNYTAFEDGGETDEHGNVTGGTAIHALYKLRLDSDDAPQYFKTLNKRGTVIEMMKLPNSEIKLSAVKDGSKTIYINTVTSAAGTFTWTLVDFEDFDFGGVSGAPASYPKKKIKKYKYLQFVLESETIDTDFGINGLNKTYYIGNFAKG